MFRTFTPDKSFTDMLSANGGTTLPILNLEEKTIMNPTYLTHHKFGFPSRLSDDKDTTYKICLFYLKEQLQINKDMFIGDLHCPKTGMITIDNEYNTSIRLWTSKKVGNMIVCNLFLAGYKGGVYTKMKN